MVPHDIPALEYERVADALRNFYLRSHRVIDRMMREGGASFARSKLLMLIARDGPLRSADIALHFDYAPRTVTEAVDGLERDGLARRDPDLEDRRAKRISLTPAGEQAVQAAESTRQLYFERVFSVLEADERDEIVRVIGKLNERLAELGDQ